MVELAPNIGDDGPCIMPVLPLTGSASITIIGASDHKREIHGPCHASLLMDRNLEA